MSCIAELSLHCLTVKSGNPWWWLDSNGDQSLLRALSTSPLLFDALLLSGELKFIPPLPLYLKRVVLHYEVCTPWNLIVAKETQRYT